MGVSLILAAAMVVLSSVYSFQLPLSGGRKGSSGTRPLNLAGRGDYYGESGSSFVIKEFSTYDQLEGIVKLTSQALPERPDGIVCVSKYTSATNQACVKTEAEYDRMARENPATCFLRTFAEYDDAEMLLGQAEVTAFPTFDIFYAGKRVARLQGSGSTKELERLLNMYQFQNSDLDLFSESANNNRRLDWGDGKIKSPMATPRTTARFVPGYDWDKDGGAFDEAANKAEEDYGNWVPNITDE